MIALLGSKVGEWIAGLIAILAAVGSIFAIGRKSGQSAVVQADQTKTIDTVEDAHEAQTDVAAKPDAAVASGLSEWSRD